MATVAVPVAGQSPKALIVVEGGVSFAEVLSFMANLLEDMDIVLTQKLVELLQEGASAVEVPGLGHATWTKMQSHIASNRELRVQVWQHPAPRPFQLGSVPGGQHRGGRGVKLQEFLAFAWQLLEDMELVLAQELVEFLQEQISGDPLAGLSFSSWTKMKHELRVIGEHRHQTWQHPVPLMALHGVHRVYVDNGKSVAEDILSSPQSAKRTKLSAEAGMHLKEASNSTAVASIHAEQDVIQASNGGHAGTDTVFEDFKRLLASVHAEAALL
eukprot:TRINITY_DN20532_c0_g1_i2.p1 TRINITY_DN20532_c0_g1~~TRINITY_DN20532_c0_g1_i2.p1  ORF type:complete len:300 (-),score=51.18 TRINITY_DN20532_c0_g1_i2:691-1503(-)